MQPFLIEEDILSTLPDETSADLKKRAAAYRINCLAGLKAADHGWLGACFSCMDILTYIYHRFIKDPLQPIESRASLHLSKGHAAMALYSVLAGRGCFSCRKLLEYKKRDGLPAHCDRNIPGIDSDSGSLGQGLSKAIGVALSNRAAGLKVPVFAVLGDGELQEGQLFEAFLSLKKFELNNLITIIDRNFLQSDSSTADIKDAHDWTRVFTNIGLNCMSVDGHNIEKIDNAIQQSVRMNAPLVIIAETKKGGGTEVTAMAKNTPRRQGIWHGKIPDDRQYITAIKELVYKTESKEVFDQFKKYLETQVKNRSDEQENLDASESLQHLPTGPSFSASLLELMPEIDNLYVLDADLEKSCRLTEVAEKFSSRFVEVGISEQDMCSIAAGLALTGKIPVVNTYASFYKRSIDQVFNAITEKLPIIFAAHYAGADYYTDGKSHQAVNDIGLMRSLGQIDIYEPLNQQQTAEMLKAVVNKMNNQWQEEKKATPAYFRLHRTPVELPVEVKDGFVEATPLIFSSRVKAENKNYLFVNGPHMLKMGLDAAKKLADQKINLEVVAVVHFDDSKEIIKNLIAKSNKIFTFEDHRRETGLGSFIANIEFRNPVRIGVRDYVQSCLSLEEMFDQHRLSSEVVVKVVQKVLSCSHNQQ
ncbi:MAG: transketolase C-terminal domain-containing protein [Candidatus Rifleibacteriota bacterium]